MDIELCCTKHDLIFGVNHKEGVEPSDLYCPLCVKEWIEGWVKENRTLREHRDLLLKVIDLKQLIQPIDGSAGRAHGEIDMRNEPRGAVVSLEQIR